VAIPALLRAIAIKPDSAAITPRFRRFLNKDFTDWFNALTGENRRWEFAGCHQGGGIGYLGSTIAYICDARSNRASGGGTAVSVFYDREWRAAGVEGYGF
jgi:hypothetical protein